MAGWTIKHGEVWSDDWDEANAFCNPDQEAAGAWAQEAPHESLSAWFRRLYDGLDVWVASPYVPAGPYTLRHGGSRGDSQGVGCFSNVSETRTEYLCCAVRKGLYPEDQRSGTPDPTSHIPRQPATPHGFLPGVAFSDDERHFALTGWGLPWLMGICAVTCAAACGSLQPGTLKVYHVVLRNRWLHYAPGTLPTTMGPLPLQSGGFMLTGIPLVMGEHPGLRTAKAEASPAKIERAFAACARPTRSSSISFSRTSSRPWTLCTMPCRRARRAYAAPHGQWTGS